MDPLRAALAKYVCLSKMIFFLHTDYNEYTLFCYHFHHHPPSPQKCSELLAYIFFLLSSKLVPGLSLTKMFFKEYYS